MSLANESQRITVRPSSIRDALQVEYGSGVLERFIAGIGETMGIAKAFLVTVVVEHTSPISRRSLGWIPPLARFVTRIDISCGRAAV